MMLSYDGTGCLQRLEITENYKLQKIIPSEILEINAHSLVQSVQQYLKYVQQDSQQSCAPFFSPQGI